MQSYKYIRTKIFGMNFNIRCDIEILGKDKNVIKDLTIGECNMIYHNYMTRYGLYVERECYILNNENMQLVVQIPIEKQEIQEIIIKFNLINKGYNKHDDN